MRRSLCRRRVKESFLVCVLWREIFGGQDLPLSIMTLVSQTCRQSISSALCRALTVLISTADMAHLTRYKTNFGSGEMVSAADRVAGRYRTLTNSGDNALPRAITTIVSQITKVTVTAATMPLVYNIRKA